ncbi:hypothetical protein AXF42_Ash016668 [Apostasia shenzhenica]|uniref:Uncharacterized protein n=1 Tax=Apostasia shenzhenica TaxID=1088818 RepID=A0A2I0A1Q9_9ASPA|nr:hypothetical protein AXF42_Ash016668 [Apostasia shenzhenica]
MAICRASSYLSFLAATTSSNPSAASFATRRTSPLVSVDGSFSHIQNLCAHHEKSIPDLLQTLLPCRSLLSNCFILFLSGIMARAPAALADTDVGFRYPCEDVSSYYSGIDGLNGAPLMKALSSVVSNHRSLRYKDVWDALKVLDAANSDNPEASSEVIEIYTLKEVEKSLAGKPKGWNREHLWPRSYGLKDCTSLTDLHNIRPADVNGKRKKLYAPHDQRTSNPRLTKLLRFDSHERSGRLAEKTELCVPFAKVASEWRQARRKLTSLTVDSARQEEGPKRA